MLPVRIIQKQKELVDFIENLDLKIDEKIVICNSCAAFYQAIVSSEIFVEKMKQMLTG
jgi:hypothetical protein